MAEKPDHSIVKKRPIVEVWWLDSHAWERPWIEMDQRPPHSAAACKSVGYLIEKDKHFVIVSQSMGDDEYGGAFSIPRGCIVKIRRLK
jgi:hypothetical protein